MVNAEKVLFLLSDPAHYFDLSTTSPVGQAYEQTVVPMTVDAWLFARENDIPIDLAPFDRYPGRPASVLAELNDALSESLEEAQRLNGGWLADVLRLDADLRFFRDPLAVWFSMYYRWARVLESVDFEQWEHVAYPYSIGYEYDLYPEDVVTQVDSIIHLYATRRTKLHPYLVANRRIFSPLKTHRRLENLLNAYRAVSRHSWWTRTPPFERVLVSDDPKRFGQVVAESDAVFDSRSNLLLVGGGMYRQEILYQFRDSKLESVEGATDLRSVGRLGSGDCRESRVAARLLKQWLVYNIETLIDRLTRFKHIASRNPVKEIILAPTMDPFSLHVAILADQLGLAVKYQHESDPFGVVWNRLPPAVQSILARPNESIRPAGDAPAPDDRSHAIVVRPDFRYGESAFELSRPGIFQVLAASRELPESGADLIDPGYRLGSRAGRDIQRAAPRHRLVEDASPSRLGAYEHVIWFGDRLRGTTAAAGTNS